MKYIDADKLIAEIERRIVNGQDGYGGNLKALLPFINSLQQEQPEVDLDDVIENYILENFGERWDGCVPVSCFELNMMANHFYKLGRFNARKEE